MKYLFTYIILLILASPSHAAHQRSYGDISGVVYIDNYDGDTITFNIPGVHPLIGDKITVRVYGIDTPEIKGKCEKEKRLAREAKEVIKNLLSHSNNIVLKDVRRDKYFRILATVVVDDHNIADVLFSKNLTISYFGDTKSKNWCE
ncbi:MAG: thermonuclease family protein [Nitrospinae bacterium]|nr:thermonuclease family protein [Nitrospinota bacterium]